jgi:hypothetical protein
MLGDLCAWETVLSMTHALDSAPLDKTRKSPDFILCLLVRGLFAGARLAAKAAGILEG